jgi:uncharacterized protein (DUF952 family)
MSLIYHITTENEWSAAKERGFVEASSLKDEGFIHCCTEDQFAGVLDRYYKDHSGLVRLTIDTDKLTSPIYFEWSVGAQDTFPHIYGPINFDAVQETQKIS